ncbi:hypothetical protein LC087_01050 [Bacillus carboniphilus]|uniref:Lipocalin-like domain-containing protein n=1 Tax=Bacillus carboniphilus TaxID=86663 RepID=A0ABY9JTZ5_9BACI|nr:hypothetical protein [Bacillus carboniphilus]WLR42859.1 hypothetical protein LC087_01050 [Bacillus carboniphilus]
MKKFFGQWYIEKGIRSQVLDIKPNGDVIICRWAERRGNKQTFFIQSTGTGIECTDYLIVARPINDHLKSSTSKGGVCIYSLYKGELFIFASIMGYTRHAFKRLWISFQRKRVQRI